MSELARTGALARIEEAKQRGQAELDLGSLGLIELPPEIASLTQLTYLSLYSNRLTALPPEIARLTQLRDLNLNMNQLTAVPP